MTKLKSLKNYGSRDSDTCSENLSVLYFEQISDDKTIMQHVIAPDMAISEVSVKKVQQKSRNITHQCDEQDLQLLYNTTVLNVLLV
jgi:hypothetical protein